MAYGYWKSGHAPRPRRRSTCRFRENPFDGGYAVACGLEQAIDYLRGLRFTDDDLAYLREQRGNDGGPLFADEAFLDWLRDLRFTCDVDAVPGGHRRLPARSRSCASPARSCRRSSSRRRCSNILNFQTLIATKAARVCFAAEGQPVVEFGLRRAQGPDGGVSASRAAYVGGCVGTSNTLAGKLFGIPAKGTHAHSWVMAFPSEAEAFEAYAEALPNNCTFLVDTYDTLEGVRHAVEAGRRAARARARDDRHPHRLGRPRVARQAGARDPRRGRASPTPSSWRATSSTSTSSSR